jgi:membrane-associated PAP2 superfamily phosphatase
MIHILLHFLIPAIVVGLFFRKNWKLAYFSMIATMLVDIDHILANPVYDPGRCSIGFHPLHGFMPIALYFVLCFIPRLRYIGIGLVIHMALDSLDCLMTSGVWYV